MKKKINCIMMLDDDDATNFLSTIIIEEAGSTNHLIIMDSGKKAIEYLQNKSIRKETFIVPDILFLDINMPCMNGWEFLDAYRDIKNESLKKMVIIVLTTSLNPDDKTRAENIPEVAGFEQKPLTNEMIENIIEKYIVESTLNPFVIV